MGGKRNVHNILAGKHEETTWKMIRVSWEDSIEMDITNVKWEVVTNSSGLG
jgi:hypothetical protein